MTSVRKQEVTDLRVRAEALLAQRSSPEAGGSDRELQKLLHELSVHQIELEMQNEELLRTRQVAEDLRDRYAKLYHEAPVGYLTLSEQGLIVQCNNTVVDLVGELPNRLQGTPLADLFMPGDREIFLGRFRALLKNPEGKSMELRLRRAGRPPLWVQVTTRPIQELPDPVSGEAPGVLLVILDDIDRRKEAETGLKERTAFIDALVNTIPNPLFYKDADGRYKGGNQAFADFIGVPLDELPGKSVYDVAPQDLADIYFEHDQQLMDAGTGEIYETRVRRCDGALRDVIFSKAVFTDGLGAVTGLVGAITDITDLRREHQELERHRAELQAIYDNAPVMMCVLDQNRTVKYANLALQEFSGLAQALLQQGRACGVIGCIYALDHPEGCGRGPRCRTCALRLAMEDTLATGASHRNIEYRTTLLRDGRQNEVVFLGDTALIGAGSEAQLLLCLEDITARARAEDAVRAALKEKEVLLAEIHHRVKNNLQLISSLINLQSYTVKDPQVQEIFKQSQNRIKAIALVHEKLYRSDNFAEIDIGQFLGDLVDILQRSYGSARSIRMELAVDPEIRLMMTEANPSALIVTELVSNSLKYGFPGNQAGTVTVGMTRRDGRISLTVRDDGVGLPDGFDPYQAGTLGYQLITSLAQQMSGTLEIDGRSGTSVSISWPVMPDTNSGKC